MLPEGATVDVEEAEAEFAAAEKALERGDHVAATKRAPRRGADAQELLAGLSAAWIDERRAAQQEMRCARWRSRRRPRWRRGGMPRPSERLAGRRGVAVPRVRPRAADQALAARGNIAEASWRTTAFVPCCATTSAPRPRRRSSRCTTGCWPAAAGATSGDGRPLPGPLARAARGRSSPGPPS